MTTKKQITANRQNAQKAGVKTEEGKEVSKRNAIKHGILSDEVIIRRGRNAESEELYLEMRSRMVEHFQPVGSLEEALVDELFAAYWRKRRVLRAERALMEHAALDARIKYSFAYLKKAITYDHLPEPEDIARLEQYKTSIVLSELLGDVMQIIHFIEHEHLPLPKILKDRLDANFGVAFQLSPEREEILTCNEAIETKVYHDGKDEAYYKNQILVAAKKLLESLKEKAMEFASLEDTLYIAEEETHILPSERGAQRIQRYESHLHRIFLQTLHELQRVQSVRLGKPAPLAAALDVTMNTENGFVS
jgi:hypothetical protein